MKAIVINVLNAAIVTIVYVLGWFVGDWINYGPEEAFGMIVANAWMLAGLTLALFLAGVIPGRRPVAAVMWACLGRFLGAMCATFTCPSCGSYKVAEPSKHQYRCTSCSHRF